ncbi:MAG: ADP-ribosylglycohydrolase family protein [Bacillota bacterium]|nr:ADP-ribosylglycohydrolase family protein [Bacillota bacterium]
MSLADRILGSLVAAGMGDAMGAPTEALSRVEIMERYGGYVTTFLAPALGSYYAADNIAGEITDDASQMYEMAQAIIETGGELTVEAAAKALVRWAQTHTKFYPRDAGPTTRFVIQELLAGKDPVEVGKTGGVYGRGVSNGAAMRVAAAGLIHPSDLDGAVKTAIAMTAPSHGTQIGYAGACAIACGIARALSEDASVFSVLQACFYGARAGEQYGMVHGRVAPGHSVIPLLGQAIKVAAEAESMEDVLIQMERKVGNHGDINVSVPCAVGLFAWADGDPMQTIIAATNVGNDTDSIACIAGSLAGALKGFKAIDQELYQQFKAANPAFDFERVAQDLYAIASRNLGAGRADLV